MVHYDEGQKMSNLPEINPTTLVKKLVAKNSELSYQVLQLEVLAEALRDERDELQQRLDETVTPVADISSLPPEK